MPFPIHLILALLAGFAMGGLWGAIPGFLKAATLELLFTRQHTTAGETTPYGIGWFVATDSLGHRYVYHGGSSVGGTTAFGVDRDSRVVFALVTNLSGARLAPAQEIQAIFDSVASRPGP